VCLHSKQQEGVMKRLHAAAAESGRAGPRPSGLGVVESSIGVHGHQVGTPCARSGLPRQASAIRSHCVCTRTVLCFVLIIPMEADPRRLSALFLRAKKHRVVSAEGRGRFWISGPAVVSRSASGFEVGDPVNLRAEGFRDELGGNMSGQDFRRQQTAPGCPRIARSKVLRRPTPPGAGILVRTAQRGTPGASALRC